MKRATTKGFTLIEAVIAMGIIVVGLVALVALAWISVTSSRSANDTFVAASIAQEGIEAVRSIRDTNWLLYDSDSTTEWSAGLKSSTGIDYSAGLTKETTNLEQQWTLDFAVDAFGQQCDGADGPYDCTALWTDPSHTEYIQYASGSFDSSAFEQTRFQRVLYLYPICRDPQNDDDEVVLNTATDTCATKGLQYEQVGVNVIVLVHWPGRGKVNEYALEERLYDWRY